MKVRNESLLEGSIRKSILLFAFPIFLGSLFQQLYNMADALIVGNFAGDDALAAVTSTGTLIFLFIGFFGGMYQGMGVVIARYFGAKDKVNVRKAICTAVIFGVLSGVVLSISGVLGARTIVEMVGTPSEIYEDSVAYIRIYFMGALFTAIYNTMCGICRALGDSKRPVHYLVVASIVNVILDVVLVGIFGMAVRGAAIATVLAQGTCAALSWYRLMNLEENSIRIQHLKRDYNWSLLKQMIQIGLPTGVQNSVIAFANVVVQSSINSFGTVVMAGTGTYSKLQGIVFLPIEAFSMALTNFVSQNLGAGCVERVKKGAAFGVLLSCISVEVIGILAFVFAPTLIGAFGGGADVIAVGAMKLHIDALFYCFLAYAHTVSSIMRGAGKAKTPMFIMLGIWCVMRVAYIELVMYFTNSLTLVFWAYPLTWMTSFILFFLAYRKLRLSFDKMIRIS
ncbi:MAG: MATE family efflux transporter [Eubacteriales bacterium]